MKFATENQINFIESLEVQTGASIAVIARENHIYFNGDLSELDRRSASFIIDQLLEIKNGPKAEENTVEEAVEAEEKTEPASEKTIQKAVKRLTIINKVKRARLAEHVGQDLFNKLMNPQTREKALKELTEQQVAAIIESTK